MKCYIYLDNFYEQPFNVDIYSYRIPTGLRLFIFLIKEHYQIFYCLKFTGSCFFAMNGCMHDVKELLII